jgi:crotonobetainyl-CoA:carnitine CoA-transferase CaiB-like acyl-CoA transferase
MTDWPVSRSFAQLRELAVEVRVSNRSTYFAARWLEMIGVNVCAHGTVLIDGGPANDGLAISASHAASPISRATIRLWDFQVDMGGDGFLAGAASGAATVIGNAGGKAGALPAEIPEKWCGLYGAILALAELVREDGADVTYDVSAADVLRAFALQNSGSAQERCELWRRNGRIPVQHGGIFPMGFYPCRDGYVALLGRSKRDWRAIRAALGNPAWAQAPAFDNPFVLAKNSARADHLLAQTLAQFDRDELLERGLREGAVIAPVFSQAEALGRDIYRDAFSTERGPAMPFIVELPSRESGSSGGEAQTRQAPSSPVPRTRPVPSRYRPLAGLRVIELCWVWSGPMVGQTLADLGAEVIKVEARERFDLYRTRGLESRRGEMPESVRIESSLYFHSLNRNKVGLELDLKTPDGLEVMKDLIAHSDLLLDNFTAGTLDRLGLDTRTMKNANPALSVVSMSGPGKGSWLQALRSYGLVLSALGGAEALIDIDGEFVGSPTYSLSDPNAALFATLAALAGVLTARQGGEGAVCDISQIEAAGTLAGTPFDVQSTYLCIATDGGTEIALSVPVACFAPGAALDAFSAELSGASYSVVEKRCEALGIGFTPVLELVDTDAAPVFALDGWLHAQHPLTGPERLVAAPWRADGQRPGLVKCAPLLGEGNDYVLRQMLKCEGTENESST